MSLPGLVLGYHGCDEHIGEAILAGRDSLRPSNNKFDWLGPGCYFWENDPSRALEFAREVADRRKIQKPFVIGAILELKRCLNLVENENLKLLHRAYLRLKRLSKEAGIPLPKNKRLRRGSDLLFRNLDCAVIQTLHKAMTHDPYDSVRGVFWEGESLYPNAGFQKKNHIQICVINSDCIKGLFRPKAQA